MQLSLFALLLLAASSLQYTGDQEKGKSLQWVLYVILAGLLTFLFIIGYILEQLLKSAKRKEQRGLNDNQKSLLTGDEKMDDFGTQDAIPAGDIEIEDEIA